MIIVNLYSDEDYNPHTDDYNIFLAGIVNDTFNLHIDPNLIIDAIENDDEFEPEAGQFYEIQLVRAMIASDPIPEPAFVVDRITKKQYDENQGWITPYKQIKER